MMNRYKITAAFFLICILFSCGTKDLLRDNPDDPNGINYKASVPGVTTTTTPTNITGSTATIGGNVTSTGGLTVTARGVCYSLTTIALPTITNSKTNDGTGTGLFVSNITGLTPNTDYNVRAYATNSSGTGYGLVVKFTTTAAVIAPIVTTTTVTSIGLTTAVGGGSITSDGGAAVTVSGVCWSTTVNPTTALSTKTTDGTLTGIFTSNITGLTAGVLYHVRAYATNSIGTSYGSDVTFTTLTTAAIPTITTTVASGIAMTTAVSGGEITFNGGAAVTVRGVCWATSINPTIALTTKTSDGTGSGIFTSNLSGLTGGILYHIRAYATNTAGTAYGSDLTFTTSTVASIPTLSTATISAITATTATGGGTISSDGGAAVSARGVCWSLNTGPTVALATKTSDGTGTGAFTSSITGLTLSTKYYVRAYATNTVGTAYGTETSFTTSTVTVVPPTISTTAITSITITSASSGGNITNDGGATISARGVCWSTTINPTSALTTKTTDGTGAGVFTSNITGLSGGTTYHVRAYATNTAGTSYGADVPFLTTAADIPTITTTAITVNTGTSAISGGNISSDGGAAVTVRGICWGLTINPTLTDSKTSDGTGSGVFVSNLTGLTVGTTYHVRAFATNQTGTAYGQDIAFTSANSPTITTTTPITSITQTTATGGGNISSDGGSPVTVRGICWSTTSNPTIALTTKTSNGTGIGAFSGNITGLSASITYYVRAYATNLVGTSYGSNVSFSASAPVIPTLTSNVVSAVSLTTATSGGNVLTDGFGTITSRGVCWSTSINPTVALTTKTSDGTGTGTFISSITSLSANTTYYLRAYATNITGTGYGDQQIFKTSVSTLSDIEGNQYSAVVIGTQTWMRENLKATKYRDGNNIANITDNTAWGALTTGAYCWYNNDITNKNIYGALYNYYTITDSRILCPTGWHVPTDAEWTTLQTYLGGQYGAADKLRETGTSHWTSLTGTETNETGFTALPGGIRNNNSFDIGSRGYWWTATEAATTNAWDYNMGAGDTDLYRWQSVKTGGQAVRCIKD